MACHILSVGVVQAVALPHTHTPQAGAGRSSWTRSWWVRTTRGRGRGSRGWPATSCRWRPAPPPGRCSPGSRPSTPPPPAGRDGTPGRTCSSDSRGRRTRTGTSGQRMGPAKGKGFYLMMHSTHFTYGYIEWIAAFTLPQKLARLNRAGLGPDLAHFSGTVYIATKTSSVDPSPVRGARLYVLPFYSFLDE